MSLQEVISPDGELLYKGPRVRMGIHWAKKGTVNHRLHPLTKHRIFAGPSWRVAGELGDAANGGQVSTLIRALVLRNRPETIKKRRKRVMK